MSDLLRIHCPYCSKALTTSIGGDDSQPVDSAKHICCLLCPDCGNESVIVMNMNKLKQGGASK